MAKLTANDFELIFRITERCDFDPAEYEFKLTLFYKGIPVLNEDAMKYWDKGKSGCIIGSEIDGMDAFINALEMAMERKTPQYWESFPDPDLCVSIFPECYFPYLDREDKGQYTLMFSPSNYNFKDADCYSGFEGVSFVMSPTVGEYKKFIADLKAEYATVKEGVK